MQIVRPNDIGQKVPQVLVTQERLVIHEAPSRRIGDQSYEQVFQISASLDAFSNPTKSIWVPRFGERADGVLNFYSDHPPFIYDVGEVTVPMEGGERTIQVPMRGDATIYRLHPAPGTVIHLVPIQSWMMIHSGNLEEFGAYLDQHPNPAFWNPDAQTRTEAIMKAQMEFLSSESETSNEAATDDGESGESESPLENSTD